MGESLPELSGDAERRPDAGSGGIIARSSSKMTGLRHLSLTLETQADRRVAELWGRRGAFP
jgi:hypothetical protein